MTNGEPLTKNTKITLGFAISLIVILFTAASVVYAQNTKVALIEREVTELSEETATMLTRNEFNMHTESIDKRLQNIEAGILRIEESMIRLSEKLDTLYLVER